MTGPAQGSADAVLMARLLARDPAGLGGIRVRGGPGPASDALLNALAEAFAGRPVRRLPLHIDEDRLCGGIDVAASLAAGAKVESKGLLAEVRGGLLIAASAERITAGRAGRIASGMETHGFALVLLDEGGEDEAPPAALTERLAFDFTPTQFGENEDAPPGNAPPPVPRGATDAEVLAAIETTACLLGVAGTRPLLFTLRAAAAAAALAGRTVISAQDAAEAARLVLAPRATQMPAERPQEPPPPDNSDPDRARPETSQTPEDVVLEAARAALPPGLEMLAAGRMRQDAAASQGGGGEKRRSPVRGRTIGSRAGMPGGQLRLALVETLRAAAPWQKFRRAAGGGQGLVQLRREDIRVRRFESRAETLTIFAVDASGSSAFARLAEAKGAVELLLERAHAERAEVALLAFRGAGVELLLPPTRSLTRARRLLADLPGGGGTPLASGLDAARLLAEASRRRGRTPRILLLTDGRANIAADGSPGRARAAEDAAAAARRILAAALSALLIDIAARPQPEASQLAEKMGARYLHLPRAPAAAIHAIAAS